MHGLYNGDGNDPIRFWNLAYNNTNIVPGYFEVRGGNPAGEGCTVVLDFIIEKSDDIQGIP